MPDAENRKVVNFRLDEGTAKDLKVLAAQNGTTIQEILENAVLAYIAAHEGSSKKPLLWPHGAETPSGYDPFKHGAPLTGRLGKRPAENEDSEAK